MDLFPTVTLQCLGTRWRPGLPDVVLSKLSSSGRGDNIWDTQNRAWTNMSQTTSLIRDHSIVSIDRSMHYGAKGPRAGSHGSGAAVLITYSVDHCEIPRWRRKDVHRREKLLGCETSTKASPQPQVSFLAALIYDRQTNEGTKIRIQNKHQV